MSRTGYASRASVGCSTISKAARVAFIVATSACWGESNRAMRVDVAEVRSEVFIRGTKRVPRSRKRRRRSGPHDLAVGRAQDVVRDESAWARNRTRDTGIFRPGRRVAKAAGSAGETAADGGD
jgi:hypothetical protein